MGEVALQNRFVKGFNKMPGCIVIRNISEGGSEGRNCVDIEARSFGWGIALELKYRDRLPVRRDTPILAPGSLSVGQRHRLSQLWLKPFPTGVLLFIGDPGPWLLIPSPCILDAESRPWALFQDSLQEISVSRISPAALIHAFDSTWASIFVGISPSLDWGPRATHLATAYLCQPRRASRAQDDPPGGHVLTP